MRAVGRVKDFCARRPRGLATGDTVVSPDGYSGAVRAKPRWKKKNKREGIKRAYCCLSENNKSRATAERRGGSIKKKKEKKKTLARAYVS